MIIDLKNQVLEVERDENNLEQQLKNRIQESERIKEDIMHLINKLDEESIKSKFENNSRNLYEILSVQIPSRNKSLLGFDKEKKPGYSSCTNKHGNKIIYVDVLMSQIKRDESNKFASPLQRTDIMPKRPVTSKHQQLFLGNCYTCNIFSTYGYKL